MSHEELLAEIEQDQEASGVPPEEIDARVAEALDVPVDCYLAYLLVWGAIEVQREIRLLSEVARSSPIAESLEDSRFESELG